MQQWIQIKCQAAGQLLLQCLTVQIVFANLFANLFNIDIRDVQMKTGQCALPQEDGKLYH